MSSSEAIVLYEAGARPIDEMVRAQSATTVRAPKLTMQEQMEWDRQLREVREAERARR